MTWPRHRKVVTRQAAQHPGEHRGGEVGPPPGGQHAAPLVVHDMAQPRVLRLATPPEEAVPGCARQRSGPDPALFLVANCWLFLMHRRPKLARSSGGGSARSSKGQAD